MEKISKVNQILIALLAFLCHLNLASARKINTEFIKTSCCATIYPKLCITSLSSHANAIKDDPKLLAHAALSVALEHARSTSDTMLNLSKTHGLKPREAAAMRDCVEEVSDSVEELRKSVGAMTKMKGSNFGRVMSDVQTWVSAALTYDDTCMEGFVGEEMDGDLKDVVRGRILKIAHLTSNALALINSYCVIHG